MRQVIMLIVVAILGLVMRMSAVQLTEINSPLRADALDYYGYAYNIVENRIYSRTLPDTQGPVNPQADFLRYPGFPLFASLFYSEDPDTFLDQTLNAQFILNSLVILAIMLTGWKAFGFWPVFSLSLLYATSPHIINMNIYFLSESLMVSLMVLFSALLFQIAHARNILFWGLAGLVLAYASLTRPYLKYFVFIFLPYLYFVNKQENLGKLAALLLCYMAVFLPWSIYASLSGAEGSEDLMVGTIHHGLYPNIEYNDDPATRGYPYRFDPNSETIGSSMESVTGELKRRLSIEPWKHIQWYLLGKPLTFWQWSMIQGAREIYIYPVLTPPWDYLPHFKLSYIVHKALHYPLLLLAFLFSILVWIPSISRKFLSQPNTVFFRCISLLLIYGTAVHMVGAPFPRYQIPQKFMMYIMAIGFAGYAGQFSLQKLKRTQ